MSDCKEYACITSLGRTRSVENNLVCPLIVHYCMGGFAIGRGFRCNDNIALNAEMSASACTPSMPV